jgi:hypothetical protein
VAQVPSTPLTPPGTADYRLVESESDLSEDRRLDSAAMWVASPVGDFLGPSHSPIRLTRQRY